jgi:signal peptidase II
MRFRTGEWDVKRMSRFGLVVLILLSCAGCDRATKNIARELLAPSPPISVLNDLVRFEYVENPGAFLGLGSNMPGQVRFALLVIFAGASLLFTLVYIAAAHTLDFVPLIGLSLVAGGGVGNLIDRIINDGAVTDFVRLGIGPFRTGIFNLADVAIVVGVAMLLLWSARETRRTRNAA